MTTNNSWNPNTGMFQNDFLANMQGLGFTDTPQGRGAYLDKSSQPSYNPANFYTGDEGAKFKINDITLDGWGDLLKGGSQLFQAFNNYNMLGINKEAIRQKMNVTRANLNNSVITTNNNIDERMQTQAAAGWDTSKYRKVSVPNSLT